MYSSHFYCIILVQLEEARTRQQEAVQAANSRRTSLEADNGALRAEVERLRNELSGVTGRVTRAELLVRRSTFRSVRTRLQCFSCGFRLFNQLEAH